MKKRPQAKQMHSSEFVRRILKETEATDAVRFRLAVRNLNEKVVHVTIESAKDEEFLLATTSKGFEVRAAGRNSRADIVIRTSPTALRGILEGVETPVEAFFLGHLRAKGETRDLYALHTFFLALAEIAIAAPKVQDLIEAFQEAKEIQQS